MMETDSSIRRLMGIKAVLLTCLTSLVLFIFIAYFKSNNAYQIERIDLLTQLAGELLWDPLQNGDLEQVKIDLVKFTQKYAIDDVGLYSSKGENLLGGMNGEAIPSSQYGMKSTYVPPFTMRYDVIRGVFQNESPIAYLHLGKKRSILAFFLISFLVFALLLRGAATIFFHRRELRLPAPETDTSSSKHTNIETNQVLLDRKIRALEQERDAALASAKAKREFLAHVSHEIRTSLNGVMGVLSLLKQYDLQGEKKHLVNSAENSATSLLTIIEDILDYSKVTSGKIDFEQIDFDLRDIVEESLALYKDSARAKKIELHSYIPLEIETSVTGDPTRLRQIITNLLSNAVKFTHEGEVSLHVSLDSEGDNRQRLRFTVEDTGIGIAPEKLHSVFDEFAQADKTTARLFGGTGLGLNVCKKLIEMQGGKVGVKSGEGHGSLFWFSMDFPLAATGGNGAEQHRVTEKQIIIFDNCETCSTILSQYLPANTIRHRTAENVNEIVEYAQQFRSGKDFTPDIILVDYQCLDGDVDRLILGLKEVYDEELPACYVLLPDSRLELDLQTAAISGIIHKPIRMQQLYEVLLNASVSEERGVLQNALKQLQGRVLLVDDEQINQHVGERILKKIGFQVEVARSGKEALKMAEAHHYDLILMDVQMPDMSGLEVTKTIRYREQQTQSQPVPIIAVTANALSSMREKCLNAGMNDFIVKPIQTDLLHKQLSPWINDGVIAPHIENGSTAGQHDADADDFDEQIVWDKTLALQYLGGDEDLLHDLIALFIDKKATLLDDIEKAMKTTDGELISCAAHAFKGAVNHFAAKKCQRLAFTIERMASDGWLDGLDSHFSELKAAADLLEKELSPHISRKGKKKRIN